MRGGKETTKVVDFKRYSGFQCSGSCRTIIVGRLKAKCGFWGDRLRLRLFPITLLYCFCLYDHCLQRHFLRLYIDDRQTSRNLGYLPLMNLSYANHVAYPNDAINAIEQTMNSPTVFEIPFEPGVSSSIQASLISLKSHDVVLPLARYRNKRQDIRELRPIFLEVRKSYPGLTTAADIVLYFRLSH